MSYLKFDKNLMINLDQSLRLEMLRTNQAGAYHCTSVVDCNTRKQHGLLVIPIPEMNNEPHVLLSSLDVTVIQHGAPFNLALHRYKGGVYSPNGHKYIREFDCEDVPRTTYRVGGVVLTKEKIFISHENRILIRYTLLEAHSPTTLRLRPMLAFRNAKSLVLANDNINRDIQPADYGIGVCLYPGYPTMYMQLNHKPEWTDEPDWYRDFEYLKDLERGVPYTEDLYCPGYFDVKIKKGESIIFSAGIDEVKPRRLADMYKKEIESRTCRTSFFNCLKNAAKQFYFKDKDGMYLISSYPWSKIRARDTYMALPGATMAIDHRADCEAIFDTVNAALERFMTDGTIDSRIHHIDLPDVPLWALWAIQHYAKNYGDDDCRERFMPLVERIIEYIIEGGHPNLRLTEQGMLETAGESEPVSWMNSTWEGRPIVPRTGLLVEFNALWYNGLRFASRLSADPEKQARWEGIAEAMRKPFIDTFLNEYGYLYDYVTDKYADPSVRPNMAIAIGLDYTPLDRHQRKRVLDIVTRELWTPKGLRTLSPKSYGYRPIYVGSPYDRELALHNGTARPWLMCFYADAYLKVFGLSGVSYVDRLLISFEDEMSQNCIGTLSQLYDGNPPFTGRGAISHVVNVAEVIRTIKDLKKFNLSFQQ